MCKGHAKISSHGAILDMASKGRRVIHEECHAGKVRELALEKFPLHYANSRSQSKKFDDCTIHVAWRFAQ